MKTKTLVVDNFEKALEDSLNPKNCKRKEITMSVIEKTEKAEVIYDCNKQKLIAKHGNDTTQIESKLPVGLEGTIVKFDETGSMAFVDTEYGEALVNVDCDWDLRLKVGDKIQLEDADIYIQNGRIVTLIKGELWLNGVFIKANV